MTDQPKQDSAPVAPEPAGLPIPPVSAPSEGQRSSSPVDDGTLARRVEKLEKELDAERRRAQSDKDRGQKALERRIVELEANKALLSQYPDTREAAKQSLVEDMLNERYSRPVSQPDLGGSETGNLQVDALALMVEAGITDPTEQQEVARRWTEGAGGRNFKSNYDALRALVPVLTKHSTSKANRSVAPSPAAAITPAGGPAPKADLKAEYIKEITAARGNAARGKAIRDKYRGMGFDPGSVDFRL